MTAQPVILDTASGKNADTENFPVGSFLLRADLRPHVHAFYKFARAADDIADHPLLESAEKLRRLDNFSRALETGTGTNVPSALGLHASLAETGVSAQHGHDLLHAFKMDAVKRRYRDWDDLLNYCRYSASPVGRYVLALHGVGEAAWPANDALCSALQVINHLQDCADDYRELDRVYLPTDDFTVAEATPAELAAPKAPATLRSVLRLQLQRLQPMLKAARDLPRHVPDLALKAETAIIVTLAEDLCRLLARRDPLSQRVKLSRPGVLLACLRGVLRAPF